MSSDSWCTVIASGSHERPSCPSGNGYHYVCVCVSGIVPTTSMPKFHLGDKQYTLLPVQAHRRSGRYTRSSDIRTSPESIHTQRSANNPNGRTILFPGVPQSSGYRDTSGKRYRSFHNAWDQYRKPPRL